MRALIASLVSDPGGYADVEGVFVLTAFASSGSWEEALRARLPGGLLVWDPSSDHAGGEDWRCVGWGVTRVLCGRGQALREQVDALFASVKERGVCPAAPPLRLFGGFAFSEAAEGLWASFGSESLLLPRWVWMQRNGRALLRFAFPSSDLLHPQNLLYEVDAVLSGLEAVPAQSSPYSVGEAGGGVLVEEPSRTAWHARVCHALSLMEHGDLQKVVLAQRWRVASPVPFDPLAVVTRLAGEGSSVTRFALQRGEAVFVGASPELLLRKQGSTLTTEALAGSLPIVSSFDIEAALPALLASDKERREHQLVLEGLSASLVPFCEEFDVPKVPQGRRLSRLLHLWSPLTARMRGPTPLLELVAALHPTPAVCGLPSAAAAAWIAAYDPPRGWYAGPVGWVDAAGDGLFVVGIRSAVLRDREAWIYAGAGLVPGSDPDREYDECAWKAQTLRRALGC